MPKDYKHCRSNSYLMNKAVLVPLAFVILLAAFNLRPAFAHNTLTHEDVRVEVGWGNEPPLVGQLNTITLEVARVSTNQPITNALAQADISITKGATSKPLDFQPQEEPGLYAATIMPTQPGQISVVFKGTIGGVAFEDTSEVEDVEDTTRFAFPPNTGGVSDETLRQLQTVITDLTQQVDQANIAAKEAQDAAGSAADLKTAVDSAYMFGMIGIGVGVAGIAIAVAMRREKV
jgi:hypothetical protein